MPLAFKKIMLKAKMLIVVFPAHVIMKPKFEEHSYVTLYIITGTDTEHLCFQINDKDTISKIQ